MASEKSGRDDAFAKAKAAAKDRAGADRDGDDEDRVEEANKDSFPTSDAPAWSTPAPVDRLSEDGAEDGDKRGD